MALTVKYRYNSLFFIVSIAYLISALTCLVLALAAIEQHDYVNSIFALLLFAAPAYFLIKYLTFKQIVVDDCLIEINGKKYELGRIQIKELTLLPWFGKILIFYNDNIKIFSLYYGGFWGPSLNTKPKVMMLRLLKNKIQNRKKNRR